MAESIYALGAPRKDNDGRLIPGSGRREVPGVVLDPISNQVIEGVGVPTGDATSYQIIAPPGTVLPDGSEVEIRGLVYKIKHPGHDYSVGRRPMLRGRHRPPAVFIAERKEA